MPAGAPRPRSGGAKGLLQQLAISASPSVASSAVDVCGSRGPLTHVFRIPRCVARLYSNLAERRAQIGRPPLASRAPVMPQIRLPSTQWSTLEAQGSAWPPAEPKCASARRHTHPNLRTAHAAAATTRVSTQHNLQNKLEVHPREPLLPRQIDEALARIRTGQQRRPRLIQFEPHASAIPPQHRGRPVQQFPRHI